jgi:hypothetical protein
VNKYKRSYGEDCVIPIICGYDGILFSQSREKVRDILPELDDTFFARTLVTACARYMHLAEQQYHNLVTAAREGREIQFKHFPKEGEPGIAPQYTH